MKLFPEKTWQGIGLAILRVAIAVYVLFGILLYIKQDEYLFFPPSARMEECSALPDAEIVTMEGTRAYFVRSGTSTKIAISYHGNGERACDSAYLIHWLAARGWNVLAVEYAGYAGDTVHKPSVELLLHDVEHADAWVKTQHFSETLIIGRSIGTGFASYHAALAAPQKLALISAFDTLAHVAQSHYPYPTGLLLKTDLNNRETARAAHEVLLIHGTRDVIVPIARGKALFDRLPQKEKTFLTLQGFGHNDVLDPPESWAAMDAFLH